MPSVPDALSPDAAARPPDTSKGGSEISDIRTSDGMFFSRAEDTILEGMDCWLWEDMY